MTQTPRVFVSHASEDKEQFVRDFATKLRSKGIDAWVAEWEIMPGDSLVDKIFEEGIGTAQAMIVVISDKSVNKPWVREELNAGVVKRINDKSKLIPVVIGDVTDADIPESLKSIVWERIGNVSSYETELDRIVRAIYEYQEKPSLGEAPAYTQYRIDSLPGLNETDTLILKRCCEDLIQNSDTVLDAVNLQSVFDQAKSMELSEQDILESVEILDDSGYLNVSTSNEGNILLMRVTDWGFEEYARSFIPDYENIYRAVALEIVNRGAKDVEIIAKAIEQPAVVVNHVINELVSRDMLKVQRFAGGHMFILDVPARLKRWLREQ